MKGNLFNFGKKEIYLSEQEMYQVHEHYIVQRNADYLKENYPRLTEEEILEMSWVWRDKEMQDGYSNEEALAEVLEIYGLTEY